ncbi:hypothetical protein LUX29_12295 [Aureimonas altamirensis]|uniref:hypothetical protein n=1 Tax=Aureimonas altamirensis TaxID=370622 RepID=UPI001E3DEF22|nr:hypothetical protein [Aureimonas altamirensis]UHD43874.1 hypothetical protein LUX29_12295 [Aureimonas altamirensis]
MTRYLRDNMDRCRHPPGIGAAGARPQLRHAPGRQIHSNIRLFRAFRDPASAREQMEDANVSKTPSCSNTLPTL